MFNKVSAPEIRQLRGFSVEDLSVEGRGPAPHKLLRDSLSERRNKLETGEVSLSDLTHAAYERAYLHGGQESVIFWTPYDKSMERAERFDKLSPEHKKSFLEEHPFLGLFGTAKDTFPTKGLPCTAGGGRTPLHNILPVRERQTAPLIAAYEKKGGFIIGKSRASTNAFEHHVLLERPEESDNPVYLNQSHAELIERLGLRRVLSDSVVRNMRAGESHLEQLTLPGRPESQIGGSSTGCACLVKQEAVDLSFGSSLSGSVGLPAALTGVHAALFPSGYGEGHVPSGPALATAGVFTSDFELLQQVCAELLKSEDRKEIEGTPRFIVGNLSTDKDSASSITTAAPILEALESIEAFNAQLDGVNLEDVIPEAARHIAASLGGSMGSFSRKMLISKGLEPFLEGVKEDEQGVFVQSFLTGLKEGFADNADVLRKLKEIIAESGAIVLPVLPVTTSENGALLDPKPDGAGNDIPAYDLYYCFAQLGNALEMPATYMPVSEDSEGNPIVLQVLAPDLPTSLAVAKEIKSRISTEPIPS